MVIKINTVGIKVLRNFNGKTLREKVSANKRVFKRVVYLQWLDHFERFLLMKSVLLKKYMYTWGKQVAPCPKVGPWEDLWSAWIRFEKERT